MSRARNIKPGFFRNEDLVELPFETRLLFIGLWTLADREGRLDDRPKKIKMELFPADSIDVNELLNQLAATDMLARYVVDGKGYLQITNFARHQNPHRDEKPSSIPSMDAVAVSDVEKIEEQDASTVQARCLHSGNTVVIGLNPESLFSDSLIPDSLIPDSSARTMPDLARVEPGDDGGGTVVPARAGPTMASAVCVALRASGVASCNPSSPALTELVKAGAPIDLFVAAALGLKGRASPPSNPFAYILATVKGQMADAVAMAAVQPVGRHPGREARASPPETFRERDSRLVAERMAEFAPGVAKRPASKNLVTVEMESDHVPAIACD